MILRSDDSKQEYFYTKGTAVPSFLFSVIFFHRAPSKFVGTDSKQNKQEPNSTKGPPKQSTQATEEIG